MNQPYIAIEGPIGVGKSSLAHLLSQSLNYHEAQEIVDENPFLSDFYDDISKWSFQTEMFFLCNRYKQVQDLKHHNKGIVGDYHVYKNKIFARQTLTDTEYHKFDRIFDILTEDLMMPDIVVFLDADLDVLKQRIAKRNRSFEAQIEDDYLLNLKDAYYRFYQYLKQQGKQVIRINTTNIDFVNRPDDYNNILNIVQSMIGGNTHE
ncbi:deoxynucleoside kinase [Staphylococcus sp. IVB6181]|uniref:deoxynucleoside kinase n=1 Tax=Staphylococcus sp. IVB6181 TaxID=2929481 RepID=UPI0021D27D28|nr:deoxynucleoside kinase [Staphylococcus sp. IVB6181]UXV34766.1 deoxynucleoside kinase [Staphylococcus sp. IVB6181]